MLYGPDSVLQAAPFDMMLKGFDEESFKLWRVSPATTEAEAEQGE
jgi:hypothetical protein